MGNKTKLNEVEAGLICIYYNTVHIETCSIHKQTMELIEKLDMLNNDEIYEEYKKIEGRLLELTKFNMESNLKDNLVRVMEFQKNYVSSVELRKLKIYIAELPEKLEQDLITFYDELIEVGTDVKAIEISKEEVLKSIKNIYFLTNRIKEVIESKV